MFDALLKGFLAALFASSSPASQDLSTVHAAVRSHLEGVERNIGPTDRVELKRYEISGMEEQLGASVYLATFLDIDGMEFDNFLFIHRNGGVVPLGKTFGGWGLMSGLVHGRCFYYTYSWGSGIHRSHVGRISLGNGELKAVESIGIDNLDLFVSKNGNGVAVHVGEFVSFNEWRAIPLVEKVDSLFPDSESCGGEF